ncbi:MAG: hypothetical protein Q7U02_07980 [Desulfosalsimonadaceae bacterium]|nr:hypothetical protein [Desulfosalsimonadaceae bacterium]
MLPLSDNLFLIQSFSPGEGKTKGMAKGLVLCCRNAVWAGESAGFGLPVLKTDNLTIFPSLFSSTLLSPGIMEAVYHLNLISTWQVMGVAAPAFFSDFAEKLVGVYMNRPGFQQLGLKIRNGIFKIFHIRSTMTPGKSFGYCRVLYQTDDHRLTLRVNGEGLRHPGQLILLNEVSGTGFSRMKTGRDIRDGRNFLPWQICTMETAIENPNLPIGFCLSIPENSGSSGFQMAAGREVGRDLDWAGLSLATDRTAFTYHVNFYE